MASQDELKINARGLSAPGPRLMVESALARSPSERLRIAVSSQEAAEDLRAYFAERGAKVTVDLVGEDYHLLVDLKG